MKKIILVGAGGHSKSVVDSIQKDQFELCGFLDENQVGMHMNYPIFGKRVEDIPHYEQYAYFVAIGNVDFRRKWYEKLKNMNLELVNIIDPSAIISLNAHIGIGNFIGKYAVINAGAEIGDNNVINTKALIEHECKVGNHIHLSTNATINGNVVVEDSVFIGSTAVCNGQLKIGEHSIVGSGSVVIRDVEPYCVVAGVPVKIIRRIERNDTNSSGNRV